MDASPGDASTDPDASTPDAGSFDAGLDAPPPILTSLRVTPLDTLIELDLDTPATQAFTVVAVYSDASETDVTGEVTWEVGDPTLGSMSGATLEVPGFAMRRFASTLVTASLDGLDGAAQVTIAAFRRSGDTPDPVLIVPFGSATPATLELTYDTTLRALDVFFDVDTTGSMDGEVTNLQVGLTSTVVPAIRAFVPDTWFGVGAYEDFPVAPYGEASCTYGALGGPDQPFQLFTAMTSDATALTTAVNGLAIGGNAIGCGNDTPESAVEAMYQIATGEGLSGPGATFVAAHAMGIGGVGFREGTLPVVVNITDAVSHHAGASSCPGVSYTDASVAAVAHTETAALDALRGICAQVVQIVSAVGPTCTAAADGVAWTTALGARVLPSAWDVGGRPPGCGAGQCCTGTGGVGVAPIDGLCPLTFAIAANGTGLGPAATSAVEMLVRFAPFDVTRSWDGASADESGVALPAGTTSADFIESVVPTSHGTIPLPGATSPTLTETSFDGVIPGTPVTFTVTASNDFVEAGASARMFIATVRVQADDCRSLGERAVYILVPPLPLAASE